MPTGSVIDSVFVVVVFLISWGQLGGQNLTSLHLTQMD